MEQRGRGRPSRALATLMPAVDPGLAGQDGNRRLEILLATWRDFNPVRQLERVCFPLDTWPLLEIIGVLTLPNVLRLKAVVEGHIAGFVAVDIRTRRNLAWIATIGVLPEYRRQGVASALLKACEQRVTVDRLCLSVRASNQPAMQLYSRFGYQRVDRWPRYYQGGEDAVVMEKVLREK